MESKKIAFPPLAPGSRINLKFLEACLTDPDEENDEGFIGMAKRKEWSMMLMSHAAAEWRDEAYEANIPAAWSEADKWDDFRREHCK